MFLALLLSALLFMGLRGGEAESEWVFIQLTDCRSGVNRDPQVSPDGRRAFFISTCDLVGRNSDLSPEIFKWDRGKLTQLTDASGCSIIDLDLAPDGKRVAFISNCYFDGKNRGRSPELMTLSEEGELQILTQSFGHISRRPRWSGDGRMIAFESTANLTGENPDNSNEIFLADLTASTPELRQLSRTRAPAGCEHPNLSGRSVICRCNDDLPGTGSEEQGPGPTVIRDGRTAGANPDRNYELFILHPEAKPKQLTDTKACENGPPALDGSGRLIAFTSNCRFSADRFSSEPRTGSTNELYFMADELIRPFSGFAFDGKGLAWSGDGRRLAFSSTMNLNRQNRERNQEIFLLDLPRATAEDLDGIFKKTGPERWIKQLTRFSSAVSHSPRLSRDGKVVVFVSNVNLQNGNPARIPQIFMARQVARPADHEPEDFELYHLDD